jgi:uncharacterized membrane protein YccF (DUF307 family)
MRFIGNVLWLVLAGFWLAIAYAVAGLLCFITIIGIPFGIQAFKLGGYALWPFGRVVIQKLGSNVAISTLGNIIWFIVCGWWLAGLHIITGLLLMVTIIGIPLGVANFKMAGLALFPFGKQIVSMADLNSQIATGQIAGSTVTTTVPTLGDPSPVQLESPSANQ